LSRRARIAGYGAVALLLVAGVVCAVLVPGGTGPLLALSLVGVGLVALISMVFMEVGLSEDRERERLQAQAQAQGQPRPAGRRRLHGARLDRMRGRRRRLR
jgi:putative copper export protein